MLNTITPQVQSNNEQTSIAFHVARDPEFLRGVQDGRQLLSQKRDLTGKDGWYQVQELLQFASSELSPELQTVELLQLAPIYNLGLVAGLFGKLAEVAMSSIPPEPKTETFTIRDPRFREGLRIGADLYHQDHDSAPRLLDRDLLAFFQIHLTPFETHQITNTGVFLGWMQAFHAAEPILEFQTVDFMAGFLMGSQDWMGWKKDDLLTDIEFAAFLANEVSPAVLATMSEAEPGYNAEVQIGYACGVVSALISDPTIDVAASEPHAHS